MAHTFDQASLDRLVSHVITRKEIYGAVFHVSSDDGGTDLISASGNIGVDSRYYIASINKLFVSSVILKLFTDNELNLDDKISCSLPEELLRRLHVHNGRDYSDFLTIAHLMSHTSGLPCYLTDKRANGNTVMAELEAGIDQAWPLDRVIQEVKRMKTHFPPGKKGRAKYSDTNHQILGLVIEKIKGDPVKTALTNLFQELGLTDTYVCEDLHDRSYVPIRYRSAVRHLPLFLTSTRNDIVSTARDQTTFLKAFFNGYFFPKERLDELARWNSIFFPFQYGVGIQKFRLPGILSPFHHVPAMVGHCGSTGSVAFHVPALGLYITGTTNQQARPNVPFQVMMKMLNKLKSRQHGESSQSF